MKTNSIFFKIRIAFGLSVLLILSVFAMLHFIQKHFQEMELQERAMHASKLFKHLIANPKLLEERLLGLELVTIDDKIAYELMRGQPNCEIMGMGRIKIIGTKKDGKRYVLICHTKGINAFEDKKEYPPIHLLLFAALIAILGVLALFYRSILASLAPLSELKSRVESFAATGEILPKAKLFCDEIEALSKAFDETATYLSDISKARSLFLRNIAHELKTPLSKGRFLSEMVQSEDLKDRFRKLFTHFDCLVNELLQVERLTAKGLPLDKQPRLLQDCIDEAIEGGFLDESSVDIEENNMRICVDFRLFALALKNLLANGIKYSHNQKVNIRVNQLDLEVSNTAPRLKLPIEQLFEPFVKGDEAGEGLGLGLYIAKQIAEAHGTSLKYSYNNGQHTFAIPLYALICKESL